MQHLIIIAHPNPKSFNHAILERIKDTLVRLGANVEVRDLYQIGFNPCFGEADLRKAHGGHAPHDVVIEQKYIKHADKITIIAPIWWGYVPAILKGYFDRVFTNGFAYTSVNGGVKGLLGSKKFGIINTFGMANNYPDLNNNYIFVDKILEKNIFEFCGSPICFHKMFFNIEECGQDKRSAMLDEVEKVIQKFVLDPNYCPYFG